MSNKRDSSASKPPGERRRASRRREDERLQQRELELEAARRICQAVYQRIKEEEVVEKALRTAMEVLGAEAGSVLLADPKSRQLVFRHAIGPKAEILRGKGIPWDKGIAGAVFKSGEPEIMTDVKRDRRHYEDIDTLTGFETRDMIALPLKLWEGQPIGVMEILNKRDRPLNDDDLAILTIISAISAVAMEHARLAEEAKLAELIRLLGDISHDLHNMLTPAVAGARIVQTELDELLGNIERRDFSKARASHRRCYSMLNVITETSWRIQDRVKAIADCVKGLSSPPQFDRCQVQSVVSSVVEMLEVLAKEKKISLKTKGLGSLPAIVADERRLFNALYNLVNNAIPETPPGGAITISGRLDPDGKSLVLSVADTGRGMPPEVVQSLFTPHTISRKPGGTGLGTKIVKDVVESHGGKITVESQEGRGTTFHVHLPLVPPAARVR
jgi:signal transduction histidine kinase